MRSLTTPSLWCLPFLFSMNPAIATKAAGNAVLRSRKQQHTAESLILSFVPLNKHSTGYVNCCDLSNPLTDENIDLLFVQRETLYNLHSLMTVFGSRG